ncbi:TetR/AcrR family transcriptional regulator [Kangiella koreensis]|uniref:Transcriptional regulator, TetR family n=1 Tax=Kangiella koreensis (strain DSM 16069 / JCM 12317 / KCTC 12182 / SW-125) TaxID=523791 RepID=C7RA99_KANKD|nr:TetR/AcrR family transcriptional regulator [Kangiella koreensis]ACV26218.1 transcriptional regulator, TetR family [Kangiella koreensis DSM 16069]
MTKTESTKSRILDAAEQLFAERGFAETSLRTITTRARVNLASVNYHFGSKKSLIQAVFDRFLQDFTKELSLELMTLEQLSSDQLEAEKLLNALIRPLLSLNSRRNNAISIFMRLLGRAYAETQGHLRRYVTDKYGHVLVRFTHLFQKGYPNLTIDQIFWRLHYMLGSMIFTLGGSDALRQISQADFNRDLDVEDVIKEMLPFLAAGMKA